MRKETLADGSFRHVFDAGNLQYWSPDDPVLYTFNADGIEPEVFGLNELKIIGNTSVFVNGKPFILRGYIRSIVAHDHPNLSGKSDYESYRYHISQAKKYGFNLVRFHSRIPSEDFVRAADELGLFIHMEIGFAYEFDSQGKKKNLALDNVNWRNTILRYRLHPIRCHRPDSALIADKPDRAIQLYRTCLTDDFAEHTQGTIQNILVDFHKNLLFC